MTSGALVWACVVTYVFAFSFNENTEESRGLLARPTSHGVRGER